jgi:hypothetical protein
LTHRTTVVGQQQQQQRPDNTTTMSSSSRKEERPRHGAIDSARRAGRGAPRARASVAARVSHGTIQMPLLLFNNNNSMLLEKQQQQQPMHSCYDGEKVQTMLQGPHLIIAGAQKSGTTALYALLRKHPRIVASRLFEAHFFDMYVRVRVCV